MAWCLLERARCLTTILPPTYTAHHDYDQANNEIFLQSNFHVISVSYHQFRFQNGPFVQHYESSATEPTNPDFHPVVESHHIDHF